MQHYLISSGLVFVPAPFFPVYCPTKAALHSFAIAMHAQLCGTNINITEVFPQYVQTGLDTKYKHRLVELSGGSEKAPKPISIDTFTEQAMAKLDASQNGTPLKEIAVGAFPEAATVAWRTAMGTWVDRFGRGG